MDKLRLVGEGKTPVGVAIDDKPKKNKKPRRAREGFCELCQLPGHINKYCWTYPEEDVSDKPCDVCEGIHGASPCFFNPEMYHFFYPAVFITLSSFLFSTVTHFRHLRFLARSADALLNSPATPASLQNQANNSNSRVDSMETDQAQTKEKVLTNSAKIEEGEDGRLNES